jgi:hypothetical protein
MSRTYFTVSLLTAAVTVTAKIQTNGLWTEVGTHTSGDFIFENGIPTSNNEEVRRRIKAPLALEETDMSDYNTKANVERVKQHLTENQFNELFPNRADYYTYENFLKAVGKFPAFCNEFNENHTGTNLMNHD